MFLEHHAVHLGTLIFILNLLRNYFEKYFRDVFCTLPFLYLHCKKFNKKYLKKYLILVRKVENIKSVIFQKFIVS